MFIITIVISHEQYISDILKYSICTLCTAQCTVYTVHSTVYNL